MLDAMLKCGEDGVCYTVVLAVEGQGLPPGIIEKRGGAFGRIGRGLRFWDFWTFTCGLWGVC